MSLRRSAASPAEPSIPSPRRSGPRSRTPAVPAAATSAGCPPSRTRTTRSWKGQGSSAPSRICRSAASGKRADASEVVMKGAEAPDVVAGFLERGQSLVREARLDPDDLPGRVEARTVDRLLRIEAFVEDSAQHLHERGAEARSSGRPGRNRKAVVVEDQGGGHHALHACARLERPHLQVDLAEHAVQVHVEAGQEVAGAQAEAGREDTGVPLRVDRDEVRRVADLLPLAAVGRRFEYAREREG